MKNFVKFEKAYTALIEARRALITIPSYGINEIGGDTVRTHRTMAIVRINTALELLEEWFKNHFPQDTASAYHSDQFTFPHFFELLKKYPELAKENEEALRSLLHSLKASDPTPTRLERIPDISEFV